MNIFLRTRHENSKCERLDSNQEPPRYKLGALTSCATLANGIILCHSHYLGKFIAFNCFLFNKTVRNFVEFITSLFDDFLCGIKRFFHERAHLAVNKSRRFVGIISLNTQFLSQKNKFVLFPKGNRPDFFANSIPLHQVTRNRGCLAKVISRTSCKFSKNNIFGSISAKRNGKLV